MALSLSLVVVAWVVDQRRPSDQRPIKTRPRPVAELVAPSPLTDQEREGTGAKFGSQESVKLERGAWVQVADAQGNLKQQYTASRIDPLPDKRLAMTDPRAVLYGDGGRIVTMRADAMTARVPKRALESGKLSGNVVIRIFRPRDGKPVDLKNDAPDVTVESPEASFDQASGEIRCDRQVRIAGEVITFDGEGLSLTLAADGKTLERLVVDRALAPVRISRAAIEAQQKKRGDAKKKADAEKVAGGAAAASGAAQPAVAEKPADAGKAVAAGKPADGAKPAVAGKPADAGKPAVAGKSGGKKAASAAAEPRLFLLTMYDDVEIVSNETDRRTVVRGDRVDAYFIMRGGSGIGMAQRDPFGPPREPFPMLAVSGSPAQQLLALAIASVPADDDQDVVTVAFKGRLVMAPAPEGTPVLSQPDAVRMVVNGKPARIEDSRSEAVITAQRVTVESKVDRVELVGTLEEPAAVVTPDFALKAKHFTLDRSTGRGASDGPGNIVMGGAGKKPLSVTWGTSMALILAPGTGNTEGTFRGAEFVGAVDVRSADMEMQTAQLSIEALPVGKKDVPRRIVASGGVKARSLGASGGQFAADRVEVALSPNAAGEAQPRTLVATGNVEAGDGAQTIWSSALRLTFIDPKPKAGAAGKAGAEGKAGADANAGADAKAGKGKKGGIGLAGAGGDEQGAMRSDVGEIVAEGPVELRMEDGGRVFATRLEGDGVGHNARLFGPDVLVVRGNLVLDQLANVQVQDAPVRLNAIGPGRASGFKDPVLAVTEGKTGRPKISAVPQMQATWRESLSYADGAVKAKDGGADRGLLLLQGAVKVRASREPREAEALDADEVQIEIMSRGKTLAKADGKTANADGKTANADGKTANADGKAGAKRDGKSSGAGALGDAQAIGTMRATGEVRLEARQWADGKREGDPRLFRMNAPNIAYNGQDGSAFVDGAGSLLVFDPPPPTEPENADAKKSPFTPHGTTRFTWKRSLAMAPRPDGTSRLTLERDVVMDHLGNSTTATGTMTADRMMATVRAAEGAKPAAGAGDMGVSLGGPAELTKVEADGRVVVRTSDMDIEAGEFELDVPSQIGIARAEQGRLVTLIQRGTANPVRAHAFRWDMVKGTVSVEGARGGIGR